MRRHQQKQLLEMVGTLDEAHATLRRMLNVTPVQTEITNLLADCQDFAVRIGTFIESIEGKEGQTIALLEEYCELLYRMSMMPSKAALKVLKRQLITIESSIKSELAPNRIEVAFLSYNASMSDSIESIYMTARADPVCDAYWIPIPYYDKLPDGSFGTMHYEGAESYDKNIGVTDWQKYDIEARHPDVIFTFYPYDTGNHVTSVHPNFYCERLRGLTDMLVYIPYFVAADNVPEHFCTLAGCVFAHRVILQSEKVREKYVSVYKAVYGNNFGKPEDKFVAIGSPKVDKIIAARREDCILPDEWQQLIGNKKVVLYITTVAASLQGDEQYLVKLRHNLKTFCERDDIVLWWRPHPLSVATYESMRPTLADEYKSIIREYCADGRNIFDDSNDLHRAISCSDAYYGDVESSVVALYKYTGKPILTQASCKQDTGSPNERTAGLWIGEMCGDGQNLWFLSAHYNALWSFDKDNWEAECLCCFPDEPFTKWKSFYSLLCAENRLFCIPFSADKIVEYSIDSSSIKQIPIPKCENSISLKIKYDTERKFTFGFACGDCIFIIPYTYPGILKYNFVTKEIVVLSDWVSDLNHLLDDGFSYGYLSQCIAVDKRIYAICKYANIVFEFDMISCKHTIHMLANDNTGYTGIAFDGSYFWLAPAHGGCLVKWGLTDGIVLELNVKTDEQYPFLGASFLDGDIWVLPNMGGSALRINARSGMLADPGDFQKEIADAPWHYSFQTVIGEAMFAFCFDTGKLLMYDSESKLMKKGDVIGTKQSMKVIAKCLVSEALSAEADSNRVLYEPNVILEDYLDAIISMESTRSAQMSKKQYVGKKIYEYVKNTLMGE